MIARLDAVYGMRWRIWSSDEGHLYASLREDPPKVAKGAGYHGLYRTVHAATAHGLEAELEKQAAAMLRVEAFAAEGL
ncbi:hypothetical protein LO762_11505 [Actinocorallia sp. API 0066]|uniref:hypothetical protein n=1 Tax=Actinocorallia sp. API 0066 TaxID=2896846 RepID=UPI001E476A2B|nr:hypothetical protein [Actinocorallia sp. API 0066]MCD0449810.1 hypothetical protein [Actinocorallia sp. API 0066]